MNNELDSAIVLAADSGYLMQLSTALKSIFANGYAGVAYVMNDNIPHEWFQIVNQCLKQGQVRDMKIDRDSLKKGYIAHPHINYMSYARIFAPELINASRLVYMDSDTIINGSIEPLLSMSLEGHIIGAVPDLSGDGFNSGILVIDGDKWRQEDITNHLWSTIEGRGLLNGDQTLLNSYFINNYRQLPSRYNYQIGADVLIAYNHVMKWIPNETIETKVRQLDTVNNPVIYHYIAFDKPWNLTSSGRMRKLWWQYYSLDWSNLTNNFANFPIFKKDLFIFTSSANLQDIEELINHMPNVRFNIASYFNMIFDLKRLLQYNNVQLYQNIIGKNIDKLIQTSCAMLDITDGPNEEITKRFAATGKPIIGYREDRFESILPADSTYELVHNVDELIDRIEASPLNTTSIND